MDWEKILSNGVTPVVVLFTIGVIVKYAVWPRITQYLDDARNDRIEAQRILRQRAENLEKREDTQLTGFIKTLDGLKDVLEASINRQEIQAKMMEETLKTVKDTNDFIRKRR